MVEEDYAVKVMDDARDLIIDQRKTIAELDDEIDFVRRRTALAASFLDSAYRDGKITGDVYYSMRPILDIGCPLEPTELPEDDNAKARMSRRRTLIEEAKARFAKFSPERQAELIAGIQEAHDEAERILHRDD